MSAMGRVVMAIQEMLANDEPTSTIVKMLRDRYGFGDASAREFIDSCEEEYRRQEYTSHDPY